jgi:hypothetical protein
VEVRFFRGYNGKGTKMTWGRKGVFFCLLRMETKITDKKKHESGQLMPTRKLLGRRLKLGVVRYLKMCMYGAQNAALDTPIV